jgi:hypothetical protein
MEAMFFAAFFSIAGLVQFALLVYVVLLIKRIADGIDRSESTLERRLRAIQAAIAPPADPADQRWPPEADPADQRWPPKPTSPSLGDTVTSAALTSGALSPEF